MKNEKLLGLIVGIVLVVLMMNFIVAEEVAEEPTFWETIRSYFIGETFTIVGQDVGASVYPDESWDIQPGDSFDKSIGNLCPSGHGLFNLAVWDGTYVPRWETKDRMVFTCGINNQKCIVDLYCMDSDFCGSDSDCGSNEECYTKYAVDPYMPLKDIYGNTISTYSYCKAIEGCTGSDITCWQISGESCQSRTYDCNYQTYPNCPTTWSYTSLSECEGDIIIEPPEPPEDEEGRIIKKCWQYDESIGECIEKKNILLFPPFTCKGVGKTITKQSCEDAHKDEEEIKEDTNGTNLIQAKKIALTKSEISKSTSGDLLASSCLYGAECVLSLEDKEDFKTSCISIAKLRAEDILTEGDTNNFFTNAKTITKGATYGAAGGVTACLVLAGIFGAGSGGALIVPALTGCAAVGALLGGTGTSIVLDFIQDDDLLDALQAENENIVGICVKESKTGLSMFEWAAFFDITGDGIKDGTDGLIIVIIGGALLLILFMRR